LKIAIVGNGILSRDLAPYNDPEWFLWGLSLREYEFQEKYNTARPFNQLWECHDRDHHQHYLKFMEDNSVMYPNREKCKALAGNEGFMSSIAYMLCHAIFVQPEEIALYGIDSCVIEKEEYKDQIPNIKYFMGLAVGKGIKVTAPERCKLFETLTYGEK